MLLATENTPPAGLRPEDVFRQSENWQPLSRSQALIAVDQAPRQVIVIWPGPFGRLAQFFDRSHAFFQATGPYDFAYLQYFRYIGPPARTWIPQIAGPLDAEDTEEAESDLEPSPTPSQVAGPKPAPKDRKPKPEVPATGGLHIRFTDLIHQPHPDLECRVEWEKEAVFTGPLTDGTLHLEGLPFGSLQVHLTSRDQSISLPLQWQKAPFPREAVPLIWSGKEA